MEEPLVFRAKSANEEQLPVKHLVTTACIVFCNALPVPILFPFVSFMVRDFGIAGSDNQIGYYAGWIGSSFMLGRCLTGVSWGMASDHYGRKPVLVIGIVSLIIFNTWFGFSTTFWMAIATRFCLGGLNGMLGTLHAVATELCSKEHQSLATTMVSATWGFGLMMGQALGGLLSQPALKLPSIFGTGSLFARYPYLLPPLLVSSFAVAALPVACFLLPETLHTRQDDDIDPEVQKLSSGEELQKGSIFANRSLLASVTLLAFASVHEIAYNVVFSLWAVRPKEEGGLAFSSTDIGLLFAVAGCVMLLFQLLVFPWVTKLVGALIITRAAAGITVPLLLLYPMIPAIPNGWLWLTVVLVSILKYILMEGTRAGVAMLINNSVCRDERGTANGIAMSVMSLFKAIGPATGGSVFAWSQRHRNAALLPGNQLVFSFLALWMLLVSVGTHVV